MNKDNFKLDGSAKNKINHEYSRPDDTRRVNTAGKRPARPEPKRAPTGGSGTPPRRPVPPQGSRPKRPAPPQGEYPPYPPQRPVQHTPQSGRPVQRRKPAPAQRPLPPPQQPKPQQRTEPSRKRRRPAPPQYIPPEQLPPYMQPHEYEPEQEPGPELPKKRKKHWLAKLMFRIAVLGVVVIILNVLFLYYRGELWLNEPRKRDYPVRGAVVTERLGKIDWEKFAGQSMSFAYIRATSGTERTDNRYKDNRRGANGTDLLCGYYHEFDLGKDGKKQAEHYIRQVGDLDGKLRPMVKVTRSVLYRIHAPQKQDVTKRLQAFIDRIEEEYGTDCIIQCDTDCYERYIEKDFSEYYDIWLISHFTEPEMKEYGWTLWEYNPRVRSAGYSNKKKYYCMSVFQKSRSLGSFKKDFLIDYEE